MDDLRLLLPRGRSVPARWLTRPVRRLLARCAPTRRLVVQRPGDRTAFAVVARDLRTTPGLWDSFAERRCELGAAGATGVVDVVHDGLALTAAALIDDRRDGLSFVGPALADRSRAVAPDDEPVVDLPGDPPSDLAERLWVEQRDDRLVWSLGAGVMAAPRERPSSALVLEPIPAPHLPPPIWPGSPIGQIAVTAPDTLVTRHLYPPELFGRGDTGGDVGRIVDPRTLGTSRRRWSDIDVFHLNWPEHLLGGDIGQHRALVRTLSRLDVPIVWTMHNLVPHAADRTDLTDLWAGAAHGIVHLSEWGREQALTRVRYRDDAVHTVARLGAWVRPMRGLRPMRETWRTLSGVPHDAVVVGVSGSRRGTRSTPEAARLEQELADAGFHVLDLTAPDHPVSWFTYIERLSQCDALGLAFTPPFQLATATVSDALGLGLPAVGTDWPFLREHLGDSLLVVDDASSARAALDRVRHDAGMLRAASAQASALCSWDAARSAFADLLSRIPAGA